jgi:hypothetical protein
VSREARGEKGGGGRGGGGKGKTRMRRRATRKSTNVVDDNPPSRTYHVNKSTLPSNYNIYLKFQTFNTPSILIKNVTWSKISTYHSMLCSVKCSKYISPTWVVVGLVGWHLIIDGALDIFHYSPAIFIIWWGEGMLFW